MGIGRGGPELFQLETQGTFLHVTYPSHPDVARRDSGHRAACQDSPRPRLDGSEEDQIVARCRVRDPFVPYMFYWNLIGLSF